MIRRLTRYTRWQLRELRNHRVLTPACLFAYRRRMRRRGVQIHPRARLYGIDHIRIGEESEIEAGAILATSWPGMLATVFNSGPGEVVLGKRCYIHTGAILAAYGRRIELGDDVSVNPYALLVGEGGLRIGDKTRIASHVSIFPTSHNFADPARPIMEQGMTSLGIDIGSDVWIGTGVRILDGVTVGDGAVLGAGCVVTRSVPPLSIMAGVPARCIGRRGDARPECTYEKVGETVCAPC